MRGHQAKLFLLLRASMMSVSFPGDYMSGDNPCLGFLIFEFLAGLTLLNKH
jgi:hypothetical protein